MASTKAPLFGLDASGSLAKSIVFSKWRGRTYVRRHAIPKNPQSGLQVGMRSVFRFITQAYADLSTADKAKWEELAAADNITALNAQVRQAQDRARRNLGWRKVPDATPLGDIDPPTGLTLTPQPKALLVEWTRPVSDQGDYSVLVVVSTATMTAYGVAFLRRVEVVTATSTTITGLLAGTEYFVRVAETSAAGEIGTLSSEESETPT